ncbi:MULTISPECIES: two-partner secretion domain-containing protein [unclassified Microcoleus]|uniref:two-partner secretion domain-containing protein n=1 Tax=unclassified Microcoleus TaxID=2642155 RepID=UPI002FD74AA0
MPRQSCALFFAFLLLCPFPAIAQIIPDNSLGTESSRTVPDTINNLPSDRITGGATRGANLFHSLQQFNVGEGRGAYFANPNGIANIFTRVTGGNPSNILGVLGVQGNANLFLLNPKGIVFGPNARLDLRGSFLASSADSVVFDNGYQFSSSNPQSLPLLNVNIPIGLNFRENPGKIINSSAAPALSLPELPPGFPPIFNNIGLAVQPGQTLALVGGDIELNQGTLTASTGQILLGSVASPGMIGLGATPLGLSLNYDKISNFGNIEITNGSVLNTSGLGGGKVDIRGGNVRLNNGKIYALTLGNIDGRGIDINAQNFRAEGGAQISTLALENGVAGAVNIRATDSVELSGIGVESFQNFLSKFTTSGSINPFDPQIILVTSTNGTGNAGNITIDTGRLLIDNGSVLGSATLGAGNAGNMTFRARVFDMAGSGINSGTIAGSTGKGGSFTFEGERLRVRDGAGIVSITRSEEAAGNINIQASESVEILRTPDGNPTPTFIGATAISTKGRAGDINIDTKRLIISQGGGISLSSGSVVGNQPLNTTAGQGGNLTIRSSESVTVEGISGVLANGSRTASFISADAYSASPGGSMNISTPVITLRDGGIISTASLGRGDAGSITLDAGRVNVIGNGGSGEFNSQIQISVGIASGVINPNATANAGSLNLNVGQLILRNGGTLNLRALGSGGAGNINVKADSVSLNNLSSIDGRTESGAGANINLEARDVQLRRASRITTDAGSSGGGNINIKSDILVALPNENSDITANARSAQGGRVNINVPNVFGFTSVTREQARGNLGLTDAQFAALQVSPTSLIPTSDIAAISQSSGPALQGSVTFSSSGVNPAQGLVELPQNVVDPAALIAANPCTQEAEGAFTVTGKGGVPASPNDALSSPLSPLPWVEEVGSSATNVEDLTNVTDRAKKQEGEIPDREVVPAQGWVVNAKGEVTLVGYNPGNAADSRNPRQNSGCAPR